MKAFENPEFTVVRFEATDIIVTSKPCDCVDCIKCPEGSNDCPCVDSWTSDYHA